MLGSSCLRNLKNLMNLVPRQKEARMSSTYLK